MTLPAENVKKYADKMHSIEILRLAIPAPVVETPKWKLPWKKSTADEGSGCNSTKR